MTLRPWQTDLIRRRLPSFDADACDTMFAAEQPERAHPQHPSVRLANGAEWYVDPWRRPINESGRPLKVKALPGTRQYLAGPGVSDAREVIVVEGEGDLAALISNGITNAICIGGIQAALSNEPAYFEMRRQLLRGKDVRLAFDFDEEGRAGAAKVARHLLGEAERTGVGKVSITRAPSEWPAGADFLDFSARLDPEAAPETRKGRLLGVLGRFDGPYSKAGDVPDPARIAANPSVNHDAPHVALLTREEFMAAPTPDPIVEDLVFEASTHFVNGASKAGKSVMVNQLALSIAGGTPFLGLGVKRSRVLLLSLEMSAGLVQRRMESIASDVDGVSAADWNWFDVVAPIPGRPAPQINLTEDSGVETIERLIGESEAEVCILDTLYRFIGGFDPSDNGQMGVVMASLNSIASRTGCALIIIHHTKKGVGDGPVSQSGLGAQIFGGASNVVMQLSRSTRDGVRSWTLDVDSHYSVWPEPITYSQPELPDGSLGMGCVRTTAAEAQGLGLESVRRLFEEGGQEVAASIRPSTPASRSTGCGSATHRSTPARSLTTMPSRISFSSWWSAGEPTPQPRRKRHPT